MINIPDFIHYQKQVSISGNYEWSVARLIELARDLPVMEIPIEHLSIYYQYEKLNLRDMVSHMKAVEAANLSFPIIMDENGEIMDGRHRVMKVLFEGKKTIKAVRFPKNPPPCGINKNED